MNKLLFALLAGLGMTACAVSPTPTNVKTDPMGCLANAVNIFVYLDKTTGNNTIPALKDNAKRVVCIRSGSRVKWHRNNSSGNNNFTIFFKDDSGRADIVAVNGRAEFKSQHGLKSIDALSYGVRMPDADKDLDPIIIIIPSLGN